MDQGKRPFRNLGEDIDDVRIECLAPLPTYYVGGCRKGNGLLVGPQSGHGVERVSHGKNPSTEREILSAESTRISFAIVTLVMHEDQFGGPW